MHTNHIVIDLGSSSGRVLLHSAGADPTNMQEVHRFNHIAAEKNGQLQWDIEGLLAEINSGLHIANEILHGEPATVGIDTWGVDYALIDEQGQRIGEVVCYRDQRTQRTQVASEQALAPKRHFQLTGTQPEQITTARQLFAQAQEDPTSLATAHRLLLLPDYLAYRLTGNLGWSQAIVSTSGLAQPGATHWAWEVFDAYGIPRHLVGEISPERTTIGAVTGLGHFKLMRVGSHDTACAVHGLTPTPTEAFISCGSWSLFGCVQPEPVLNEDAYTLGLTNEVCTDGQVRLLQNLTGLWILQQCCRNLADNGETSDIAELASAAEEMPSTGILIDTTAAEYATPGDYVSKIRAIAQDPNLCPASVIRIVIESLAHTHAVALRNLMQATGTQFTSLRMIGGGVRNALLCQLTADACGIPLHAGMQEGTAFGSLMAQLQSADMPPTPTSTYLPR